MHQEPTTLKYFWRDRKIGSIEFSRKEISWGFWSGVGATI